MSELKRYDLCFVLDEERTDATIETSEGFYYRVADVEELLAAKDAEIAALKRQLDSAVAISSGVTHHDTCWQQSPHGESVTKQIAEMQEIFDLRWKSDMRAIKLWQATHPGNDLVWPDHADLCVWLLSQIADAKALLKRANGVFDSELWDEIDAFLNPPQQKDGCEFCGGTSGGVKGNENVVDGKLQCDYCSAKEFKQQKGTNNVPSERA